MRKNIFRAEPLHPFQMALFILIQLLVLFGETFSKFNLYGSFYLYDTVLLLLGLISTFYFIKRANKDWNWPVLVLLILSFLYLLYSYFIVHNPTNYLIRQYALFIYLGLSWLIFSSFINLKFQQFNIRFVILIGISSVVIQLLYTLYLVLFTEDFSLFDSFNYFSKMVIVGIIVFGAFVLVYLKNKPLKVGLTIFYILLILTLGHSSAFLAGFTVVVSYVILQLPNKAKIAGAIIMGISVLAFFLLLPQFSDTNAEWRLVFWKYSLIDIIKNYYTVLGHGFGVPYPTQETLDALRDNLNSPWFEVRPEEMYTSPMHNSFITMAFHVGLIPSLLIFIPILKPLKETLLAKRELRKPDGDFLLLSWIGLTVWASFNVVLELPHSSLFYWLIYFSLIFQFKNYSNSTLKNEQ